MQHDCMKLVSRKKKHNELILCCKNALTVLIDTYLVMLSRVWVSSSSLCLIPLHISLFAPKSFSAWNFPYFHTYTECNVSEPECFSRNPGRFSMFPLPSWFIQTSEIPATHRQKKTTWIKVNLKRVKPTAWQDKQLPAASAVLLLKAIDLKCWKEIIFLVFGGLQRFCLILFRRLQLWNTICAFSWCRKFVCHQCLVLPS